MAITPENQLQQVTTLQPAALAYLINAYALIRSANLKFDNFQNTVANLGETVNLKLPYRATSSGGLIANLAGLEQRLVPLTVNQSRNASYSVGDLERVFNLSKEEYMTEIGKSVDLELGAKIESNVARNAISGVQPIDIEGNTIGGPNSSSGPYRFYGDGRTSINTIKQLIKVGTDFADAGTTYGQQKMYIPSVITPDIVQTALSDFVLKRNERYAASWSLGTIGSTPATEVMTSNLLPIHFAGNVGQNQTPGSNELTVVSVNDPTGQDVTQITFSGADNDDDDAIQYSDVFQFLPVTGKPDVKWLTFIGHEPSSQWTQFRATAKAASDGTGNVIVNIYPGLNSVLSDKNANITTQIQPGMKVKVMDSHRAGLFVTGNAYFLAMPSLPNQSPFVTSSAADPHTGCSMRITFGTQFGQAVQAFIHDAIWGSLIVPEYCSRILFPINQA